MRRAILKVRPYAHSPIWKFVLDMRGFGKSRMFFKSRQNANIELKKQRRLLDHHGKEALALSQRDMSDFIHARDTLAKFGETIADAVRARVDHWQNRRRCDLTVGRFKDEYLAAKEASLAKGELRKSHIRDLKSRLNKFCAMFGDVKLTEIDFNEIEKWLRPYKQNNRRSFYTVISGMFKDAARKKYITENPLINIQKPDRAKKRPEIFSIDELSALLETAQRIAPDVLPLIALGAFAGVRTSIEDGEINRMTWDMIDWKRSEIDLPDEITKTGNGRVIPMSVNLIAWLRPYAGKSGAVLSNGARYQIKKVCKDAGIAWKTNAARHSFASYRLVQTKNAPLVAYELGHAGSPTLLYKHYRNRNITPEQAEAYFQIAPKEEQKVTQFKAA